MITWHALGWFLQSFQSSKIPSSARARSSVEAKLIQHCCFLAFLYTRTQRKARKVRATRCRFATWHFASFHPGWKPPPELGAGAPTWSWSEMPVFFCEKRMIADLTTLKLALWNLLLRRPLSNHRLFSLRRRRGKPEFQVVRFIIYYRHWSLKKFIFKVAVPSLSRNFLLTSKRHQLFMQMFPGQYHFETLLPFRNIKFWNQGRVSSEENFFQK